jgi:hypothetical protein
MLSSTLDKAQQTTTTRGGRHTKARQIFVPGSKSSKGECWGVENQPGNASAATSTPSEKELKELGTDIYYDVLKCYYHWEHSANTSLAGGWILFNPQVPSKERVENVSKFTGYQAVATRYKQDDENLDTFLTRCGHDHAEMMARNSIENKKKRKQCSCTTASASAEEEELQDDDESTLAMEDGSSSSQDAANNETTPEPTRHHRVRRRDPTAARVSLSPSLRSAKREDPPASGETTEERFKNLENLLKTAMGRIHQLEKKNLEYLKAGR